MQTETDLDSNLRPHLLTVEESWQQTPDARGYINSLLKRNKRICFGVLERPFEHENKSLTVLHKKLFLVGKSGVGKTSTINKLAGRDIRENEETVGIQTHTLYWPAKLISPRVVILVELELWDTGERALNKFDHILPACEKSTQGTLLFFSYEDRKSWEDLPKSMSSVSRGDGNDLKVIVGTHLDTLQREVTDAEVKEFEQKYGLIVLPINSSNGPRLASDPTAPDGREVIKEITPFMNALTQVLLAHEQRIGSQFASTLEGKRPRLDSEP